MLNTLGIIAEYNPFHNGHALHINKSKMLTGAQDVIIVMSGNFVQRGEPAIFDKYVRAKMALLNGADIVLELPIYCACASSYYFALGAVKIMNATGIVDCICFGSESGDIAELESLSRMLNIETCEFKRGLKYFLSQGMSYPSARARSAKRLGYDLRDDKSNNLLGIEYLRALHDTDSQMKSFTIKRQNTEHDSLVTEGNMATALLLRNMIKQGEINEVQRYVPLTVYELIKKNAKKVVQLNYFSDIIQYIIKNSTSEKLSRILDINEGLENRFISAAGDNYDACNIIRAVKTKRYTHTRISRSIVHMLLDITKNDFDRYISNLPYVRVLGFKKSKEQLLSKLIKNSKAPVITNLKKHDMLSRGALFFLQKEIQSTDTYYLGQKRAFAKNIEYSKSLIIV